MVFLDCDGAGGRDAGARFSVSGWSSGPAALVPGEPGPKGPRKLTSEVVDYLEQRLSADPELRPKALAGLVEERFGVRVHPRSVERALERRREEAKERPKSGP